MRNWVAGYFDIKLICVFFFNNLSWSEASLGTYKFLRSEFYLTSLAVNHVFIPAQVSSF